MQAPAGQSRLLAAIKLVGGRILDARHGALWTETLVSFAVNKGVALNVN